MNKISDAVVTKVTSWVIDRQTYWRILRSALSRPKFLIFTQFLEEISQMIDWCSRPRNHDKPLVDSIGIAQYESLVRPL